MACYVFVIIVFVLLLTFSQFICISAGLCWLRNVHTWRGKCDQDDTADHPKDAEDRQGYKGDVDGLHDDGAYVIAINFSFQ